MSEKTEKAVNEVALKLKALGALLVREGATKEEAQKAFGWLRGRVDAVYNETTLALAGMGEKFSFETAPLNPIEITAPAATANVFNRTVVSATGQVPLDRDGNPRLPRATPEQYHANKPLEGGVGFIDEDDDAGFIS